MTGPDSDRPASRGYRSSPIPPSPRPSIASRASRSSLRREVERQEGQAYNRPTSVTHSRPHTPHTTAAPVEEPARAPSPSPPPQPTQPPFSPVFALLSSTSHSTNRQTVHHPTVHYIFADDDPEILTAALAHHHQGVYNDSNEEGTSVPPNRGVLLDMEPTADGSGYEVTWASSLTPDWAVTSATITRSEGGLGEAAPGFGSKLVLNIEGVSLEPSLGPSPLGKAPSPEAEMQSSGASAGKTRAATAMEEYADLLQDFDKRMSILRRVVEAGAARQRALGEGGGQFSEAAKDKPPIADESAQDRRRQ
ncbi:hypothetical protein VTH82DRAFT_6613 [Thermothelomyces myriococcoides]